MRARLRMADLLPLAGVGLRARPLRVLLSALGIAIGIAALTAVVGISASSRAEVDRMLARLGTNLLTAAPGTNSAGQAARLPAEAPAMMRQVGPVLAVAATGRLDVRIYRTDRIPAGRSNSIEVLATGLELPEAVGARLTAGAWLNPAISRYPAVVLGARAAELLGVETNDLVWLGARWTIVAGVLEPVPLAPELDTAALVGFGPAARHYGFDGHPTTIYVRAREDAVESVRAVLAATADPQHPEQVKISRPSDALSAKRAADRTFVGLLLGLGAVALLVGGLGVGNTMVISVLERRAEVGLRRALGATRGHIRLQFLAESLLLSTLGGLAGVLIGGMVTVAYAAYQGWPAVMPAWALLGAPGVTIAVGGLAGLYPAVRAARVAPTAALTTGS